MKNKGKRLWSAWLLLAVFVPTMLVSSLHHHGIESTMVDCADCLHHVHHPGHLQALTISLDDCVLCQFLSLLYVPAKIVKVCSFSVWSAAVAFPDTHHVPMSHIRVCIPRAPPFFL